MFCHKTLTQQRDSSKDESVILDLFESCYESLGELALPEDLRKTFAKKCAKTNYYFRFFGRDRFLVDQQYKYIQKLINDLIP